MEDYLVTVHAAATCEGLTALHRDAQDRLPPLRTLYRWHQRFAKDCLYFPAFTLEDLGLVHLHLFVTVPDVRWARFPYAVESAWCTTNLVDPVLYLHCLVPAIHRARITELLHRLPLSCAALRVVWSGSSWQRIRLANTDGLMGTFPVSAPRLRLEAIPPELLFAIPVIAESWNTRLSLPLVWRRIHHRLGDGVRSYLHRQRMAPVNGKKHVKAVLHALQQAGTFRQHVLRLRSDCTFIIVTPHYTRQFPDGMRALTRTAELFPTDEGGALWRVEGAYELLFARTAIAASAIYLVEQQPAPAVRLQYEWLFDPKRRCWSFPEERIIEKMQACA